MLHRAIRERAGESKPRVAVADAMPTPIAPRPLAAIILAAGKGTRMKSDLHKVLHPIAGRPMLFHLLAGLDALAPERVVVVVGDKRDQLERALSGRDVAFAVQEPQLGTAHAVLQAKAALAGWDGDVLILSGDVPFITPATMRRMLAALHADTAPAAPPPTAVVLGFRPPDAAAYGRIVADPAGVVTRMVEHRDASDEERRVGLCNSNLFAIRSADLWPLLERVGNSNAQGEYYLPDIVTVATADGRVARVIEGEAGEAIGPNARADFALAEAEWQARRRVTAMADGATLVAPETVWFAWDTVLGRDVTIEPGVVFGPGVSVADGAVIHAFSHLEGASVGKDCSVGPYARLRPGAVLERGAKVGNFVEVKAATLGEGAKASHLTYLGDASIGAGANIGAGTITCNYDGFLKYRTSIGAGAFIGSNSALVAPVSIGDGAIVAAGSVVTADVEADALVLVRPPQVAKPGWAARFRERMRAKKAQRGS